jgi:hypothetical protein
MTEQKYPKEIERALEAGVLKRLPLTFLPFVNQQLHQWEYLFPNERRSVQHLLVYVAAMSEEQSSALFADVRSLEDKMGVRHWQFSTAEQTIENSSELARSPYFQEWRRAVQAVFNAVEKDAAPARGTPESAPHRLVLLEIPKNLPLDSARVWRRWQGIGIALKLDLSASPGGALQGILLGSANASPGLLYAVGNRPGAAHADTWVIDAGRELVDPIAALPTSSPSAPVLLSNARLDAYRQNFSHEMNSIRKDLADADAVFDHLRKVDVSPWCSPEVAADPAVREFVRSLYLTGNGAVIFGNSFVEWAASEAFRRARPSLVAARFGMRSKPKPFTGVAVFENPDQVNPLPAVDDPEGSSLDAQMLALYIWLAATRYEEYHRATVCVCIAESLSEAYIVAPPEFILMRNAQPVPVDRLGKELIAWMAQ